mgnify:CR=1 FL=1
MKKISLCQPVYKKQVKEHYFIKSVLLDSIKKAKSYSSRIDSISSLDWEDGGDFQREWVALFLPFWYNELSQPDGLGAGSIQTNIGYRDLNLQAMWFQQYQKNDSHGWHIHSGHYTGVYYLELDKKSPRTQLRDPLSHKVVSLAVNEGDMVVFPSHIYHREPINKSAQQKTIISWNLEIL